MLVNEATNSVSEYKELQLSNKWIKQDVMDNTGHLESSESTIRKNNEINNISPQSRPLLFQNTSNSSLQTSFIYPNTNIEQFTYQKCVPESTNVNTSLTPSKVQSYSHPFAKSSIQDVTFKNSVNVLDKQNPISYSTSLSFNNTQSSNSSLSQVNYLPITVNQPSTSILPSQIYPFPTLNTQLTTNFSPSLTNSLSLQDIQNITFQNSLSNLNTKNLNFQTLDMNINQQLQLPLSTESIKKKNEETLNISISDIDKELMNKLNQSQLLDTNKEGDETKLLPTTEQSMKYYYPKSNFENIHLYSLPLPSSSSSSSSTSSSSFNSNIPLDKKSNDLREEQHYSFFKQNDDQLNQNTNNSLLSNKIFDFDSVYKLESLNNNNKNMYNIPNYNSSLTTTNVNNGKIDNSTLFDTLDSQNTINIYNKINKINEDNQLYNSFNSNNSSINENNKHIINDDEKKEKRKRIKIENDKNGKSLKKTLTIKEDIKKTNIKVDEKTGIVMRSYITEFYGKKPFKCNYCQMSFKRKYDLTRHVRLHTGEKPYVCEWCNKKFYRPDQLCSHRKSSNCCNSFKL